MGHLVLRPLPTTRLHHGRRSIPIQTPVENQRCPLTRPGCHGAFIPSAVSLQQSAREEAQRRYAACWAMAQAVMNPVGQAAALQGLTLNTAESLTFRMPEGAGYVGQMAQLWDRIQRKGLTVHGGHGLTDVVSPGGLSPSGLYGHSSNQQMMRTSSLSGFGVGDDVFLRPQQIEVRMLQFGDIAVFDGQRIPSRGPVLPASD